MHNTQCPPRSIPPESSLSDLDGILVPVAAVAP